MSAGLLAMCTGALAALSVLEAAASARHTGALAARRLEALLRPLFEAGREGRAPGAAERRRLLAAGALVTFCAGLVLSGPGLALAGALAGPWLASRLLALRRDRHRREVEAGAPAVAHALADALGGGHSLRGALVSAAPGLRGAAGYELRRVAAELALGARTEQALEALRARARCEPFDAIVAAALLQRGAGGDLAGLLRELARSFEDHARLRDEVRAATAQARFTGLVVFLLPLGGGLLAELASPGWLAGLAGSFLTAWLGGLAIALQVVAALAIRRLGRVRE